MICNHGSFQRFPSQSLRDSTVLTVASREGLEAVLKTLQFDQKIVITELEGGQVGIEDATY